MGSAGQEPQVITFDYQFAPNAQKARNLLNAAGIPFDCCEQPFVLPRPSLTDLGITYRRVPVNAIGKDLYCDNRPFLEAVQKIFKDKALPSSPADHAYESMGYRTFWTCLQLVPKDLVSKDLAKDRADLFPIFSRSDYGDIRQSALGELRQWLDIVENDFLSHGKQWIAGDKCGAADIHAIWMLKWVFQTVGVEKEPGFQEKDFPRFYRWMNGLPRHSADSDAKKISAEEAHKRVLAADYAAEDIGVDSHDPTGLSKGAKVMVETNDEYVCPRPGISKFYADRLQCEPFECPPAWQACGPVKARDCYPARERDQTPFSKNRLSAVCSIGAGRAGRIWSAGSWPGFGGCMADRCRGAGILGRRQ
jgi:glutathione S-transferase